METSDGNRLLVKAWWGQTLKDDCCHSRKGPDRCFRAINPFCKKMGKDELIRVNVAVDCGEAATVVSLKVNRPGD